jgi:hypothetical protein
MVSSSFVARVSPAPVDGTLILGHHHFGGDSTSGKGKIPNARGATTESISSDIEPTQMTFLLVFSRSGDTGPNCAQAAMGLQTHKAHFHLHASITGPLKNRLSLQERKPGRGAARLQPSASAHGHFSDLNDGADEICSPRKGRRSPRMYERAAYGSAA